MADEEEKKTTEEKRGTYSFDPVERQPLVVQAKVGGAILGLECLAAEPALFILVSKIRTPAARLTQLTNNPSR